MAADRRCWRDWGSREMQQLGKLNIDDSFIGTRIEYLSEFDLVGKVHMK